MTNEALAVLLAAVVLGSGSLSAAEPPAHAIDHIGIGASDLDRGIAFVAERTGVTAVKGGVHPGRGTQNALMSLGGGSYLEIIAPVPGAKLFGQEVELRKLATPKPVFFAVRSADLEATWRLLKESQFSLSAIDAGTRKRPDGTVLKWKTFDLTGRGLQAAPFFIEWDKDSPHPSTTSPGGCTLARLDVYDREAPTLTKLFRLLGVDVPIQESPAPALRLTLSCPRGPVVFGP